MFEDRIAPFCKEGFDATLGDPELIRFGMPAAIPAGLALRAVALSRVRPRRDGVHADLPEDAPSSAADHGALADGYWVALIVRR
ncbi:MAG: hypothetical protein ABSG56_28435 [Bryobacteraceae bacterium]|jgi:hypothetical protein